MHTALTIAGSDSGGGAGIQADLKTFAVHGVFGTSAVTALTAQNTQGVSRVFVVPTDMVTAQIDAVMTDIGADAVKIGMLATAEVAHAVADALEKYQRPPLVLDTVMVAKGGARLLDQAAVDVIRRRLIPLSTIVTANLPEAGVLADMELRTLPDLRRAARAIVRSGAATVVVKGGHLDGPPVDVFDDGVNVIEFVGKRIDTVHTHGTGCTMAAAIAAHLALGVSLAEAVDRAKQYVARAIEAAPGIGVGHGPLGWGPALLDR